MEVSLQLNAMDNLWTNEEFKESAEILSQSKTKMHSMQLTIGNRVSEAGFLDLIYSPTSDVA